MRIFYQTAPHLSRSIHRVEAAFKRYAPASVVFVDDWRTADLCLENAFDVNPLDPDQVPRLTRPYGLLWMGDVPPGWVPPSPALAAAQRQRHQECAAARFVYSFLPHTAAVAPGRVIVGPLGVDPAQFPWSGAPRDWDVLTTGYVAPTECLDSVYEAVRAMHARWVHIGGALPELGAWESPRRQRYEGIPDTALAAWYRRTRYVTGCRGGAGSPWGFELPVLEGLCAGARPICLDLPPYRHWYGDHAVYVAAGDRDTVARALQAVLAGPERPVTPAERDEVAAAFAWERVARAFWHAVL